MNAPSRDYCRGNTICFAVRLHPSEPLLNHRKRDESGRLSGLDQDRAAAERVPIDSAHVWRDDQIAVAMPPLIAARVQELKAVFDDTEHTSQQPAWSW